MLFSIIISNPCCHICYHLITVPNSGDATGSHKVKFKYLTPIQKIAITEKYRPIYEKQAKENQLSGLKNQNNNVSVNLPKRQVNPINTSEKLASIANVSEKTYRMGAKILNSDNEKLKQEVLSGEKSNIRNSQKNTHHDSPFPKGETLKLLTHQPKKRN